MNGRQHPLETAFSAHWGGRFDPVGTAEHEAARDLFRRLLTGPPDADIDRALADLRLRGQRFDTPLGVCWLVHEQPDARRGRGVYALRPDAGSACVLQAPHTRNDMGTGLITAAWMTHLDYRAAGWNTLCRRAAGGADLARAVCSYMTALAEATADALPRAHVLQIHGYRPERRRSSAGRSASAILSSGDHEPNRSTRQIAGRLACHVDAVRVFPDDVRELGATANAVGRRLRTRSSDFVHLELARELRERIRRERPLCLRLGRCLLPGTEHP